MHTQTQILLICIITLSAPSLSLSLSGQQYHMKGNKQSNLNIYNACESAIPQVSDMVPRSVKNLC